MEKLLTEQQVETLTGLSKRWLQKLRCQGAGPKYLKIGQKKILYRCSDIENFLKDHERTPTSHYGVPNNPSTK